MARIEVLVMTAVSEDNPENLLVVIVADAEEREPVSPVITLEGAASCPSGNPYLVYGDAIEEFTGCDKFDTSINVFDCRSGDLLGWR